MRFHYTYRLIAQNPIDDRVEYIGVRSCECSPVDDAFYMSSSRDVAAQIKVGVVFTKQIIAVWRTRKDAVAHEVQLHAVHDVARSPRFFNKAKQTSTAWDSSGVKFSEERRFRLRVAKNRPEVRARMSESTSSLMANPENRAKLSKAVREAMAREDIRAKYEAAFFSSEFQQKQRDTWAKKWSDSEFRAKHLAAISTPEYLNNLRNAVASPEVKAKHAAAQARPEYRKKLSAATKAAMSDPSEKARRAAAFKAVVSTPEWKAAQSKKVKLTWSDPVRRAARTASRNAVNAQKAEFCKAFGIANPGKGYGNIDKTAFSAWLNSKEKKVA